jgi:hypothetical protein
VQSEDSFTIDFKTLHQNSISEKDIDDIFVLGSIQDNSRFMYSCYFFLPALLEFLLLSLLLPLIVELQTA